MAKNTEHKVVLTIPDIGLTKTQINSLKKNFKNDIVTHLGGAKALAAQRIVVVVVVVLGLIAAALFALDRQFDLFPKLVRGLNNREQLARRLGIGFHIPIR